VQLILKKVRMRMMDIGKFEPQNRHTISSDSDWFERDMGNHDQINEELMVIYYAVSLIL
jgi:hypothetical protein